MRLLKVLLLLAVIGGVIAVAAYYSDSGSSSPSAEETRPKPEKPGEGSPALEERYGFTSQTVGQ